jgi:hypothetical protein
LVGALHAHCDELFQSGCDHLPRIPFPRGDVTVTEDVFILDAPSNIE